MAKTKLPPHRLFETTKCCILKLYIYDLLRSSPKAQQGLNEYAICGRSCQTTSLAFARGMVAVAEFALKRLPFGDRILIFPFLHGSRFPSSSFPAIFGLLVWPLRLVPATVEQKKLSASYGATCRSRYMFLLELGGVCADIAGAAVL
jgi:hypothetical protein